MATKMTYDNLAHELGRVALNRDELRFELYNVKKERDEALEKLAAMESQEPAQWVCELSSNPWPNGGGTRRDTKEEALNYINSDSNHCKYDTVSPIYRLPVPADKPAVAVPDGWKEIVEAVAHIGVDFGYGAFVLSQEHINKARELLASAPSHSQQSADTVPAEAYEQATEAINNIYGASQHCDCHSFEIAKQWRDETHGGTIYDRCPRQKSTQAWQQIETANKSCDPAGDTELILGFVPHSCGGYICAFYWNDLTEEWQNNVDGGTDRPSHWMPLPEPPTADRCPSHESEKGDKQ